MTSARIRLHVLAFIALIGCGSLILGACGNDPDADGSAEATLPTASTAEASATSDEGSATETEDLNEEEAQALVAGLAERMAALKSYQYEVQIIPSGPVPAAQPGADIVIDPEELSSTARGSIDIQHARSSIEWKGKGFRLSDESATTLAEPYIDVPLDYAAIKDGQTRYVRDWHLSEVFGAPPTKWLRIVDTPATEFGPGSYAISERGQAMLFNVIASSRKVEVIGWEDIRGIPSTHLAVRWDLGEALLAARAIEPTIRGDDFTSLFGDGSVPLEIWLDAGGYARRIDKPAVPAKLSDMHPALLAAQSPLSPLYMDLIATSEYFGFDEPVSINVPALDETWSLQDPCSARPDETCPPLDPALRDRIDAYTEEARGLAASVDTGELAQTTGLLETAQMHFEEAGSLQFATRIQVYRSGENAPAGQQEANDVSGYVDAGRGIVWVLHQGEPAGRPSVGKDYPLRTGKDLDTRRIAIPVFYSIVDGTPGFLSLDEVGSEVLAGVETLHYRIAMSRVLDLSAFGINELDVEELEALAGHNEYVDVWIDGQGRLIKGVIESYAEDGSPMRQTIVIWGYDRPVDADIPMPPLEP